MTGNPSVPIAIDGNVPTLLTGWSSTVVKIVPADTPARDAFGCLAGRLEIVGDVESPVAPAEDWEAAR